MRALRGSNATAVIARLTPIIRGWAAYYRGVVSSKIFSARWTTTCGSSPTSGPNTATRTSRRSGSSAATSAGSTSSGTTGGCSGPSRPTNAAASPPGQVLLDRHRPAPVVTGGASPDDPDLIDYWATRRRRVKPPLDSYNLRLLTRQDGRCPLCGDHLLTADQPPQSPQEWERWWLQRHPQGDSRRATSSTTARPARRTSNRTRLVHASCHRGLQARKRRNPAPANPQRPRGLLEPCAAKVARTVLRGPRDAAMRPGATRPSRRGGDGRVGPPAGAGAAARGGGRDGPAARADRSGTRR